MGHPLIDQFVQARELRQEFFRRCQRVFRDEVQPQLDERERLLERVKELEAELTEERLLNAAAEPLKRGPSRPRKVHPDDVAVGA